MSSVIRDAEDRFCAGDVEGFLALFPDKARFCIPGRTPMSGDHDRDAIRPVLERMAAAIHAGEFRPEVICRYGDADGAVSVLDNHVEINGARSKYHSVHEWIVQDGRLMAVMVYLHEYDLFEAVWP